MEICWVLHDGIIVVPSFLNIGQLVLKLKRKHTHVEQLKGNFVPLYVKKEDKRQEVQLRPFLT
jgi:hypothetical protein